MRLRRSISVAVIQSSAGLLYCPVCTIARMSSSVNAMTWRAAQKVSSGRRFTNGGWGSADVHASGSNVLLPNLPTSGRSEYFSRIHAGVARPRPAMVLPTAPRDVTRVSLPSQTSFEPSYIPLPSDLVKSTT